MTIQLICKNGKLLASMPEGALEALASSQPMPDKSRWGRTPFKRRQNLKLTTSPASSHRLPQPRRFNEQSVSGPGTRIFQLYLDMEDSIDAILPISNNLVLDLQDSFAIQVRKFTHIGTAQRCKAALTVFASPQQLAQAQEAYPLLKLAQAGH